MIGRNPKDNNDALKANIQASVRRHAPEFPSLVKVAGVGILAVLSACSVLPLIPLAIPGISETTTGLIAGLGGNTLASVVYDFASSLAREPSETETEHLTRLARILEQQIQQNEALRKDINRLLQQTDAVDVAIETLQPMNKFNEFSKVMEKLKEVQWDLRNKSKIYIDTTLPLSDGNAEIIPSVRRNVSDSIRLRGF